MTQTLFHAADRLLARIERCAAPVCVGIDPVAERLPQSLQPRSSDPQMHVDAIASFVRGVLEAVHEHVPCVKYQSACFERYGWRGVRTMQELVAESHSAGLEVILDAKRGDIGISATHYAAAAFESDAPSDWLTINAYLGDDGIEPFLLPSRGAFALVRTSNPGGDAVQQMQLANGSTVAHAVAKMIDRLGRAHVGHRGFSALGAVVGATKAADAGALRELMPQQIFLVPGYGAQGGTVNDILPCFVNGTGAIITASRSVLYPFDSDDSQWQRAIEKAAERLAEDVGSAVGLR